MTRTSTVLTLAILSSLLTPIVVSATSSASDKPAAAAPQVVAEAGAAAEAGCVRRIKIVYAGYGEGQGAPCTVEAQR